RAGSTGRNMAVGGPHGSLPKVRFLPPSDRLDFGQGAPVRCSATSTPCRGPIAGSTGEWEVTDTKKLWKVLGGILLVSFGILLFMGRQIYLTMPPIPAEVRTASGDTLYTKADIQTGQKVWQMVGGHQMGSVWGHGSYVAPDWTADWLHRESVALLDLWAVRETGRKYDELDPPQQAGLQARL